MGMMSAYVYDSWYYANKLDTIKYEDYPYIFPKYTNVLVDETFMREFNRIISVVQKEDEFLEEISFGKFISFLMEIGYVDEGHLIVGGQNMFDLAIDWLFGILIDKNPDD